MYHEIIHTNLCLLKEKGHNISFEEGMFRRRNEPGFEKVGHALLTVIDPVECKKTIPWPLLNDKIAKNSFRINFAKFLKFINKKYPDAKIPEITASNLQHPGGENFLHLMYKLSSFAVKLELERIIGTEELNDVCLQPKQPMTSNVSSIKLQIMDGVIHHMEQSSREIFEYEPTLTSTLQQLKSIYKHLNAETMAAQKEFENETTLLKRIGESVTKRQGTIEDVISDWNIETEKKIKELDIFCDRLCRTNDLTTKSCNLIKAVEKTRTDTLCMDGSQLLITPAIDSLAGSPVMNSRGQVKLEVLLKAGAAAARSVVPISQPTSHTPLSPLARNLLTDVQQQEATATETLQSLLNLCAESKEAINKRIPVIKHNMEEKELPDHLKYLDHRQPLQFICEDSTSNQLSPFPKRNRMSLNSMINCHREKRRKVICSIRKRRSVSKYSFEQTPRMQSPRTLYKLKSRASVGPRFGLRVPSTCVSKNTLIAGLTGNKMRQPVSESKAPNQNANLETTSAKSKVKPMKSMPACKKSIYGKLPTGLRDQGTEDITELPLNNSLMTDPSFSESASVFQSSPIATNTEESVPEVPPKKPRKSILDIVERYRKLKESMKTVSPKK